MDTASGSLKYKDKCGWRDNGLEERLIANKFDGSKNRRYPGWPRVDEEIEGLVVQFAKENRSWGYDRIAGALWNLGYKAEVWTKSGLVMYYVLFFIHLATRRVHIAGITPYPNEQWLTQVARNVTMADVGFLSTSRYLILDCDGSFCPSFRDTIEAGGVKTVKLPARSPNLNSFAERWVKSVKEECLSKLILFGEKSLQLALNHYVSHHHHKRNHQGKVNLLLFPGAEQASRSEGPVRCRERLGGLLKFYYREAA